MDADPATPGFQPAGESLAPVTTTDPAGSYASIQAAIDDSDAGGTVQVAAGQFDESLVIGKPLTLRGARAGVDARDRSGPETVIEGSDTADAIIDITGPSAHDISVDGFTLRNPDQARDIAEGFSVHGTEAENYNITLRNNIVENVGDPIATRVWGVFGFHIYDCRNVLIERNYIRNILCQTTSPNWNATSGLWLWGDEGVDRAYRITIQDNRIEDCTTYGVGLSLAVADTTIVRNTIALGSTVPGTSWSRAGIRVGPYASTTGIIIQGNDLSDSRAPGWSAPDRSEDTTAAIRVQNFPPTGGTRVFDNVVSGGTWGLDIYWSDGGGYGAQNVTATGNSFLTNAIGLRVGSGCTGLTITKNAFSGNALALGNLGAGSLTATANWWGDASGPYNASKNADGLGNPVSDNVTFFPWDAGRLQLSAPFRVRLGRTADVTARLTLSDGTGITVPVGVTFTATGGSIDPESPVTTAEGVATARWTTGAREGSVDITASAAGLEATVRVWADEPAPREPAPPPATTGGFTAGSEDGTVTVDVPENISDVPIKLTVAPSDDPPPTGGNLLVGHVFDVEMYVQATGSGVHDLSQSLTMVFHVSAADLAAAGVTDPSDLRIWYWDADTEPPCWVALPTVYDPVAGTLTVTVDHLTTFAAMVDPDFPALPDAAGHWAEEDILRLSSLGVVNGYEDGSFRPEVSVTRAQFAKFIVLSLGLTKGTALPAGFGDAPSVQAWAVPYVSACLRDGIMTGSGGLIRPNDTITRAEASAMVVRALGLLPQGGGAGAGLVFTDSSSIPSWAAGFVAEASAHGLIEGLPGNVFDPSGKLTRAQAVTVLSKAIDME